MVFACHLSLTVDAANFFQFNSYHGLRVLVWAFLPCAVVRGVAAASKKAARANECMVARVGSGGQETTFGTCTPGHGLSDLPLATGWNCPLAQGDALRAAASLARVLPSMAEGSKSKRCRTMVSPTFGRPWSRLGQCFKTATWTPTVIRLEHWPTELQLIG